MTALSIVALQPVEQAGIGIDSRYLAGDKLGSGLTARVVIGQRADGSGPLKVALKIAFGGMAPSERVLFWRELALLRVLSSTGYVPWAAEAAYEEQATLPEPQRTPILIMQLIDPAEYPELASCVRSADDEARALAAAVQYADLLTKMHAAGVTTRLDRKLADLRWREAGSDGHLIVLDWNRAFLDPAVARLRPSDNDLARREREMQALAQRPDWNKTNQPLLAAQRAHEQDDIRLFGRLWSQMLLRRQLDPDNLPPLTDAAAWGHLSDGTRHILAQSMLSRLHNGYQRAADLHGALKEWLASFRPGDDSDNGGRPVWLPDRNVDDLTRKRDAMLGAIKSNLNLSEYALAAKGVADALDTPAFRANDADASRARLRLHRLGVIAAAGDVGLGAGLWMRDKVTALVKITDNLHNPNPPYTPVDINALARDFDPVLADAERLRTPLIALIEEIAVWYFFRLPNAGEVEAHGHALRRANNAYAADLYAGHPRLNHLLADRMASTTRDSLRAEFDSALRALLTELTREHG